MEQRSDVILSVRDLSVSYGQVKALRGINLEVRRGEIVVLAGANGAGKTTIMETILGIHTPDSGTIVFEGSDITGRAADKNVRDGISLAPEGRGVFSSMTVLDNLLLGAHHHINDADKQLTFVFASFPILEQRKNQNAGTLSGGERQMLALGRSLMSTPRLIMADEPSIGLAPLAVNRIFDILVALNKQGYSILLSEQNIYRALKSAHRAYVLENGRVLKEGPAEDLLGDPLIREAYLGT